MKKIRIIIATLVASLASCTVTISPSGRNHQMRRGPTPVNSWGIPQQRSGPQCGSRGPSSSVGAASGQKVAVRHNCPAVHQTITITMPAGAHTNCWYCNQVVSSGYGSGDICVGAYPLDSYASYPSNGNTGYQGGYGASDSPFSNNYVPSQSGRTAAYYDARKKANEVHLFDNQTPWP